ncbi:serine hydrolase [Roseococcus sp. DSY-14]|uniref:serine hydrolase n=1 Tax=Roseococcus sp. DSY-14 TaxID=3369650 RepID=UPI00387B1F86
MLRRRALPAIAPLAAAALAGQGRAAASAEGVARIVPALDEHAAGLMRRTGVPGLALAVARHDRVLHLRGFGVRAAGRPEPVDADTVFQLASLSKPVAATVIAALVGDGVVGWDDPVARHDPGFALADAWTTRAVTLRDLLCHRSGLPDHAGDLLEDLGFGREEVLHRLRHVPPGPFRAAYAYTNFGFTQAAVAAARAAGQPWEELSAARLYRRIGMARTTSRFAQFQAQANRALGHVPREGGGWVPGPVRDADAQSPAGGVSSSARDLSAWLRLQLGRGRLDGAAMVQAAALDETQRPQVVNDAAADPARDGTGFYGLGWNVGRDAEGRVLWNHSGAFNLGAATCVHILPAEDLAVVVLVNARPVGVAEALCRACLDLATAGRVTRDWLPPFAAAFARMSEPDYGAAVAPGRRPERPQPPLPPGAYAGAYRNALYGEAAVAEEPGGLLALHMGPRGRRFPLAHFNRDSFTFQPDGENASGPAAVAFSVGPDGRAGAVTVENLDAGGQGRFLRHGG